MTLFLKIDTDENQDFFALYDHLSPLRQKIWRKIAAKCRAWNQVVPSQRTVARWCGCSRSAVNEAFRVFRDYGWIYLKSRGRGKTKAIIMSESKKQLDVNNRQYFKRVEATSRATYTVVKYKKNTSTETTGEIAIPHFLIDKENIPLSIKIKLGMVSDCAYSEALFQCNKKAAKGFVADDAYKYFCGVALAIAQKRGEKLNWPAYYYTLGKKCNQQRL